MLKQAFIRYSWYLDEPDSWTNNIQQYAIFQTLFHPRNHQKETDTIVLFIGPAIQL